MKRSEFKALIKEVLQEAAQPTYYNIYTSAEKAAYKSPKNAAVAKLKKHYEDYSKFRPADVQQQRKDKLSQAIKQYGQKPGDSVYLQMDDWDNQLRTIHSKVGAEIKKYGKKYYTIFKKAVPELTPTETDFTGDNHSNARTYEIAFNVSDIQPEVQQRFEDTLEKFSKEVVPQGFMINFRLGYDYTPKAIVISTPTYTAKKG